MNGGGAIGLTLISVLALMAFGMWWGGE